MMTLSNAPQAGSPLDGESASVVCDEVALIRATLEGNARAFDDLVRAFHRRVFNFIHQMTRQRQDAEDLTQQTFIKAFNYLARFDPQRPFINWLLTIARNTALNHFRAAKKWEEVPHDAASSDMSPARQAEHQDQSDNIWDRARAILAPRDFEVLWLRVAEELSVKETAEITGLTETHVKVTVFRARQALLKGVKRT